MNANCELLLWKIESGLAGHAIHDLTGAPYHYFFR